VEGNAAVLSLGNDGLAIVDLSKLPKVQLRHPLAFGSEVRCAAIRGDQAIVGLNAGEIRIVHLNLSTPLRAGRYLGRLNAGIRDRSGNVFTAPYTWLFEVVGPRVASLVPRPNGVGSGLEVEALFKGSLDPSSTVGALSITALGPDGKAGTADDERVAGDVAYTPGSPVITRPFPNPLPPGKYQATLSGTVANSVGLQLGSPRSWQFTVVRTNLSTNTLSLSGTIDTSFGIDEYGLQVLDLGEVVISNPKGLEIRLFRPDGVLLILDSRTVFKASFPAKGLYALRIAKGSGNFSQPYTVLIKRFTTQLFQSTLPTLNPQNYSGRVSMSLGDIDEFLLQGDAGATYFIPVFSV
jgi:hypothetical protein